MKKVFQLNLFSMFILFLITGAFSMNSHAENMALKARASASSSYCSTPNSNHCYFPYRINDNSRNTGVGGFNSWTHRNKQSGSRWVKLTWPRAITTSSMVLFTSKNYELKEYKIQYWSDNRWKTLSHVVNNTGVKRNHRFSTITTNQVRILVLKGPSNQPNYGRVNELVVNGTYAGLSASCIGSYILQTPNVNIVRFTDRSTSGMAPIQRWDWQFIGGSPAPSSGPGPHTISFSASWVPNGRVTVTDTDGNKSSASCSIF